MCWSACAAFRGIRAAASLKLHVLAGDYHLEQTFRGIDAAASLKQRERM